MVAVRKLIDIARFLIHQNEPNERYFHIIRCLDHKGDWTPHSMTNTVEIWRNWLSNGSRRQIFSNFEKPIWYLFEVSASNCTRKKCGERNFETKVLKGVTLTHIFCGHHQLRSKFHRSHRDVMFEWWRAFAPNRRQCRQAAKQKRYDLGDSVEKQSALNINKSLTMLNGILFVEE